MSFLKLPENINFNIAGYSSSRTQMIETKDKICNGLTNHVNLNACMDISRNRKMDKHVGFVNDFDHRILSLQLTTGGITGLKITHKEQARISEYVKTISYTINPLPPL